MAVSTFGLMKSFVARGATVAAVEEKASSHGISQTAHVVSHNIVVIVIIIVVVVDIIVIMVVIITTTSS